MFTLVITWPDRVQTWYPFKEREITLGSVAGNHVVLPDPSISWHHARLIVRDSQCILVDLNSTSGTFVNDRRLTTPLVVRTTDQIRIGDYTLEMLGRDVLAIMDGLGR
jgi:pilus assembly protein CpaF